ncbi:hypothetical protein D9598_05900 [Roseomonas sp. KE0001]|nr:hypothetical protein [Roseomonas sp. KE0001]
MSHLSRSPKSGVPPTRQTRRLSDKLWMAFHQACDQKDLEVARDLLHVLERVVFRSPADRNFRWNAETLVAAHERLWALRNEEYFAEAGLVRQPPYL